MNKKILKPITILLLLAVSFSSCEEKKEQIIKLQERCHCIMDTLKGEWSWFKTYGGIAGKTTNSEFKSIVKILSQNEDTSINYEVFVADTLFYKSSFLIQYDSQNQKNANIKLPHRTIPNYNWIIFFEDILAENPSNDVLIFAFFLFH